MDNSEDSHINVTKDDKKDHKAQKKLDKEKRKDKSQQKVQSSDVLTTSSNENKPNKKVVKAPILKVQTPKTADCVSLKTKVAQQLNIQKKGVRLLEKRKHTWFKDLYQPDRRENFIDNIRSDKDLKINIEFIDLGSKIDTGDVQGSTERCKLFLNATKKLIMDFQVDKQENFSRIFGAEFDRHIDFISQCRPLAVTMRTFIKYVKSNLMRMTETDNDKCKASLVGMIDEFLCERIKAAQTMIVSSVARLIKTGDRVLIHSHSQLVFESLLFAWSEQKDKFHVFVVANFHDNEHKKMTEKLKCHQIPFTQVFFSAAIIKRIDLVLLGAYSVLSNNSIMCSSGALSVAIAAKSHRIPVVVCAETYKFYAQSPSDACVSNELGDPDALMRDTVTTDSKMLQDWRNSDLVTPLDPLYDVLPHRMVSAICCELGTISPTSASSVTHLKQPVNV